MVTILRNLRSRTASTAQATGPNTDSIKHPALPAIHLRIAKKPFSLSSKWILPLCEKSGIGIVTGGPYNSGILATGAKPGAFYYYDPAPQNILDRANAIKDVCKNHDVRMVDAAFQFPQRHPAHVAVIPGGQGVNEMTGNLQAAHAEIPVALWADFKSGGWLREDAPV